MKNLFSTKKAVFIFFAFIFTAFSFAEESDDGILHLTVDDAVQYAINGNLDIKQSEITLGTYKRAKNNSWNTFIPSVTASGSFTQSFLDPNISSVSAGGSVSLGLSPSVVTSIRSAVLNYENQEITYETAVKAVELNVRQLFTTLLYQKEYIEILEASVQSAQRQYESDLAKYNRGTLAQVNVLSDQVSLQSAQLTYENQKITYENNRASFKQILGISQDTKIELEGSLDSVLSLPEITEEYVSSIRKTSTSMASLEKQKEIAENSLLATRFSAWGPSISASYNLSWSGNNSDGTGGTGDFSFANDPSTNALTLSVSIPLDGYIPWSSGATSIQSQKDTIKTLDVQIESQKITEDVNIQNYLNTIKSTQSSMKLGQSNVRLAEQTLSLTEDAYNHGTKSLLELQTARDNLNSAKTDVLSNATTLITAILNLENTLGIPFGTLTDGLTSSESAE